MRLEKKYEPSHIRRGRLSTVPTWYVWADDGRYRFTRKRDAQAFIEAGGCSVHYDCVGGLKLWCKACRGIKS